MALFDTIRAGASGTAADYEVQRSLRFNSSDNANLTRTSSSTSTTFTYSAWIKRTKFTGYQYIFSMGGRGFAFHTTNNTFYLYDANSLNESSVVFRDPSAWYHILVQINSGVATSYVNGVIVHNAIGSGFTLTTGTNATRIGVYDSGDYDFDGYMAEIHLVDGSVLAPSFFVETDSETGQLIPKNYTGSHGTNGFHLNFSDNSGTTATTLGKDYSGNSNNFTPNNFSVASGKEGDSFADTPSNNFCTLNPLVNSNTTQSLSNGGLTRSGSAQKCIGTFILENGKYYFEYKAEDTNANHAVGVTQQQADLRSRINTETASCFAGNGEFKIEGGSQTSGFVSWGNGDIVQVAIDTTLGTPKVWFGVNNSWQGASGSSGSFNASGGYSLTAGKKYVFNVDHGSNSSSTTGTCFFGAHQGGFNYDPPTGFVAASQENLPDPTIAEGDKHFDTLLYTGNNGSQNITGLDFDPDWVWAKNRQDSGYHHDLYDIVRGNNLRIFSSQTNVEATGYLQFGVTGGFSLTAGGGINTNSKNHVAWCWKAGGSASSNGDGSLTASVSVNTTAGFSIGKFTAQTSGSATVGHGLGVTPDVVFTKSLDSPSNWYVYHKSIGQDAFIFLDSSNNATTGNSAVFNPAPTSSVFTYGSGLVNQGEVVFYAFSSVKQFSQFGSYIGNGSTDGMFIPLSFRPAFIMVKRSNASENWAIWDNKRDSGRNPNGYLLRPDSSTDEGGNVSGHYIDILSNGFKIRNSDTKSNGSGDTYLYFCFAESPFKYARAR